MRSARGSLLPGVCGQSLTALGSDPSCRFCRFCRSSVFDSSCSTTPFSHDVWFSLFVCPFCGDVFFGDIAVPFWLLFLYRKASSFEREAAEAGIGCGSL
ncbi:hypothetical protein BDW68DRAFT_157406 [Aspergillus falconensis]